jgi:hypothetical protein
MRARIRSVKPELLSDEELWDLGVSTGLPVLQAFVGLWMYADKQGRFEWRPRALAAAILPFWDGDFASVLAALAAHRFIVEYEVCGKRYGVVRSFRKHQVINNREVDSVLPAPPLDPPAAQETEPEPAEITQVIKRDTAAQQYSRRPGHVYVAAPRGGLGGVFKIGFSERSPESRVSDLNCASPIELELIEAIQGTHATETEIHQALAQFRSHREWFHVTDESLTKLGAWFTRAPRVLHAGKAEGNGNGMGTEGSGSGTRAHARDDEPEPEDPVTRETVCPLGLVEKAEASGLLVELAEKLGEPLAVIRDSAQEFVAYWTIGGGAQRKRSGWMRKLREHIRRAKLENRLRPPGAVEHIGWQRKERGLTPEERERALAAVAAAKLKSQRGAA